MEMEYKLQVMIDKGNPHDYDGVMLRDDIVRVRWFLEKTGGTGEVLDGSANMAEIINTFVGVLDTLPGVDRAHFTRYTAELSLAEHITKPENFMGMLKTFVENDLAAILGGRTQISLTTEVTVL